MPRIPSSKKSPNTNLGRGSEPRIIVLQISIILEQSFCDLVTPPGGGRKACHTPVFKDRGCPVTRRQIQAQMHDALLPVGEQMGGRPTPISAEEIVALRNSVTSIEHHDFIRHAPPHIEHGSTYFAESDEDINLGTRRASGQVREKSLPSIISFSRHGSLDLTGRTVASSRTHAEAPWSLPLVPDRKDFSHAVR